MNENLWAPWRIQYLRSLEKHDQNPAAHGCFLCSYWQAPQRDRDNLVLWRTAHCLVLLNRFPYTGGHLLIAPREHVPSLDGMGRETMLELMLLARDAQKLLEQTIRPQGFNLGINFNRCAGAGLPEHIHLHIVPRWDGDTNFMSTCTDVRVISQGLDDLHEMLVKTAAQLNLPTL